MTGDVGAGAPFVAIADQGDRGVAFVLDPLTGAVRGRVDIGGTPEGVVDWAGRRLLLFCSVAGTARLVAYDLASLRVQWQTVVDDRSMTKAPGGAISLAVGSEGRLVFVLHYKALRPGDANAPGASLSWLTGHDASTGAQQGRVDLPDCVGAGVLAAGSGFAYVRCRDVLHVIETTSWSVARTLSFDNAVTAIGTFGERAIYGVTREFEVIAVDLETGIPTRIGKYSGSATAQAWGRLAITPSGRGVWVIAKGPGDRNSFDPDTLAAIDLQTSSVFEIPTPGLRGVGLVGTRVVFGTAGTLRSTDGAIDRALIDGRVEYWHIFAEPAAK